MGFSWKSTQVHLEQVGYVNLKASSLEHWACCFYQCATRAPTARITIKIWHLEIHLPQHFIPQTMGVRNRWWDVLTDPFSMTLLSIITALEHCSQIISQKWPQVFLKGPCRHQAKKCSSDHLRVHLRRHWHLRRLHAPEKGCTPFGLLPSWLNSRWCSHFQSFEVLPDCDHLKADEGSQSKWQSQRHVMLHNTYFSYETLTGADISVAVQVPVRLKLCHFVRIFAGLVTDLLLETVTKLVSHCAA